MSFQKNKAQEDAIKTIDGPVMIVSCPGSGKTTTLIRRIHHIIESGVNPASILMVTFSKAAALEMREKYEKFFGENPGISFQTIHSLCFNLLIREGRCARSDVLQENDKLDFLINVVRSFPDADGDVFEIAKSVATEISSAKNNYAEIARYEPENCDADLFREVYRQYEEWKRSIGKIDFDDMLIMCVEMLKDSKPILDKWKKHFTYIQCDEYQDTNMIQRDVLYMLSSEHNNLCVVGDDDQSIYRFRGARPEIMLHFMDDFPNAKKIMMGTNYRSAEEVVDRASKIILKNKIRYGKKFVSQRGIDGAKGYTEYIRCENKKEEMERLVSLIEECNGKGVSYDEMAILFRNNAQAILPVSVLSATDIPFYSIDAVKCIYDGWIFKDIKTYTDLACGNFASQDEERQKIYAVLNKPKRFLNQNWFQNARFELGDFRNAIYPLSTDTYWKYQQALGEIDNWMRLMGPGRLSLDDNPSLIFQRLIGGKSIRYDKHIIDMAKFRRQDPNTYFDELDELKNDAMRFNTIREWFAHAEWMIRFVQEENRKKERTGVALSTMHRSKGLEWSVVFIIDCNDGIIPSRNSSDTDQGIEEERRLFYVAMTRAKDELYVFNTSRDESVFVKEAGLLTRKERELKAAVPKYLPGHAVYHKAFGEGALVAYGPNNITIDFPRKGRKTFQFPQAFKDGFLSYEEKR